MLESSSVEEERELEGRGGARWGRWGVRGKESGDGGVGRGLYSVEGGDQ